MQNKGNINKLIKEYSCMTLDSIFSALELNTQGLSEEKVQLNRHKYGSNMYFENANNSIIRCIKRAFINPFSIILFALGTISFVTDILLSTNNQKSFTSIVIIFSMLLISGIVRFIQELRSKTVADDLKNLVHTTVKVLRSGNWVEMPASELVVGDQIILEAGDFVPADTRIAEAKDLFVSQSVITGEAQVLEKNALPLGREPQWLNDYNNMLFRGSTIIGGYCQGIVLAVGENSVYGGLGAMESERKHGFDRGANSIALVLIKFMVVLLPIVFIISGITKSSWLEAFLFALSVAVGLTPELLPMVVNACLTKGSYSMGKKQTIVKNINAMQNFGSMDILCVDKTGTLTGDTILLEYFMDVLGNESQKTLDYAYLASFYHTGVGNPIDKAILRAKTMPGKGEYYEKLARQYAKIDEYPFDHDLHFSSVLLKNEDDLLIIKGSVDNVVERCKYIEHNGKILLMEDDAYASVHAITDEMLEEGMKLIAVAYKKFAKGISENTLQGEFVLLGYLAFFDAPKKSAAEAIKKLQELKLKIKVLTGDQQLVAHSICNRLGINIEGSITGKELATLSKNDLPLVVEHVDVFSELTPKQKAFIVETLQNNGHMVGFLGDGMNDLPASLQADVGISVENATDAVKECSDVILLKKDLNVLAEGVLEGRKAFANMSKYIKITASSNFGNICAVVIAGIMLPFFPMTSIQFLLLNLLYDILCFALPWDNVDEEMLHKPLEWSGKRLREFITFFGPLSSVFDLITFAFLYFILCPWLCGGDFKELASQEQQNFIAHFQTGWFLESMWTQVLILQLLRTKQMPFIQSMPGKPVVAVTIIGIMLFTFLPYTALGDMLGLCAMPLIYYAFLVSVVILYLLLVSFAKRVYIHKTNNLV